MSMIKQKRQTALDYLLDGKDRLKDSMKISFNKQYDEFLFTEKNVLKNMRDANLLIERADKVMSQIDNFDNKQLQKKQSIYAPYFTGQKNTAPVSPKKMTSEEQQQQQHQKPANHSVSIVQSESNLQPISNQKIKTEINDLIQSYQINEEKLKNDSAFVNSVMYNNLQSIQMQNALRMKQLQEKDRNKQIQHRQFTSLGQLHPNKSQSTDVFVPYANERDNLGFIIEPDSQNQRRKKLLNLPVERQKISLIVPPNSDKVLVIKRGVHFFDKGSQLKTTRDDNLLLKDIFKINLQKANSKDSENSSKMQQKTEVLIQQQIDNQKINDQIHQNIIALDSNQNTYRGDENNQNFIDQVEQSSSYDNNTVVANQEDKAKNQFDSSHNLQSNITTFHNSSQTRHQSQDSLLPRLDNGRYIHNNQNVNKQKYYIPSYQASPATTRIGQSYQNGTDSQFVNQQADEKSTSVSQMNLINGSIQNSLIEHPNQGQSSLQIDYINQANLSRYSINANPSIENFQGSLQSATDLQKNENRPHNFHQNIKKNQSLMNIQIQTESKPDRYSLSILQSKTVTAFDRKLQKNKFKNEIVLEEKLDGSASLIVNESKSRILGSHSCIEVNMKQNKGGQVSEFQIGKFILMPESNDEQEIQHQDINKALPASVKKQLFEGNQHFKWKMNALDEAQLLEMIKKQNESKVKLPKIQIYNKKKYVSDQYPAPGDYDPDYTCIEKHNRQVYFDKASFSKSIPNSPAKDKNKNEKVPFLIPKNKSTFLPKNIVPNKEEGYEIMFSELMKDIKKEVRKQKIQNKELQHPMQGLQLNAIPHTHIIELNKSMGNQMSYCKSCLNNIKYYLRVDNPTILKKKKYRSLNF